MWTDAGKMLLLGTLFTFPVMRMVLLFSTDPDGICHIETSGLDGESNLKQKQVVRRYAEQVKNVFSIGDVNIFF